MLNGESVIREKTDEHAAGGIVRSWRTQLEEDAGTFSTDGAWSRRDYWSRYFRTFRFGRALCWAGADAFVRAIRNGVRVRGAMLCGVCGDDPAGGQCLYLCVRHTWRVNRVDHWMGPDAGIRDGSEHGFFGVVQPLHRTAEYVPCSNAVVAGLRSLDGALNGGKDCGATDGVEFGSHTGAGHASVSGQSQRHHGHAIAGFVAARA